MFPFCTATAGFYFLDQQIGGPMRMSLDHCYPLPVSRVLALRLVNPLLLCLELNSMEKFFFSGATLWLSNELMFTIMRHIDCRVANITSLGLCKSVRFFNQLPSYVSPKQQPHKEFKQKLSRAMYPVNDINQNWQSQEITATISCNVCLASASPSPPNVPTSQVEWQSPAPFLLVFDRFSAG